MDNFKERLKIVIISDGTGETATAICRAAMAQFEEKDVYFTRYKNVRSKEQVDAIFDNVAESHDLVIYTMVSPKIRNYIGEIALKKRVRSLDVLGPVLTTFANYFEQEPSEEPGLLYAMDKKYFDRIHAMEFTLNHDDGRNLNSLHLADVILIGVSRTSKTPLSVYLSQHGLKVVNIPLVMGTRLPKQLFEVDQRKIFALTIAPDALMKIRRSRLNKLGSQKHTGQYADEEKVIAELEWARRLFSENKTWPVFDVTNKALEETAAEILRLINLRKNNMFLKK
ncbi:MAG: pyruvate, water dikinase regulatory protein [Bacteriovoracaceae bacterium]